MGYTLIIGELDVEYDNDIDCPDVRTTAKITHHEEAPAFGEPTDKENQRWPSYGSWHEFCRFVGLHDLFYDDENRDDALMAYHPYCVPLTEKHREEINKAFDDFKKRYPKAKPTYGNRIDWIQGDPKNPEENGQMCRLVWLHYWVNWALDNCEKPVFTNS